MNHKHMLTLLQTGFTTVQLAFREDFTARSPSGGPKTYTYKAMISEGLKPGDVVVVDSPSKGLVCVDVVTVDPSPRISLDSEFKYKWIVAKVDVAAYDARMKQEEEFEQMLVEVERTKQRELLLAGYKDTLAPDSEARKLFDKAVASFSTPAMAVLPPEVK